MGDEQATDSGTGSADADSQVRDTAEGIGWRTGRFVDSERDHCASRILAVV